MLHPFLSGPVVQRLLTVSGPLALYTPLAGLLAWGSVSLGRHSPGGVVCGLLAVLVGVIVAHEIRYLVTGRWPRRP
ncbi:MAG: hypothetical protein AAGK21_00040 [Bacteroidota bacterium]